MANACIDDIKNEKDAKMMKVLVSLRLAKIKQAMEYL